MPTAEAIKELVPPLILDEKYTGEAIRINKIKEMWGNLTYPDVEIISPSGEHIVIKIKPVEEKRVLILPERLTNPYYGSAELEQHLREMAKKAPGIEKIWEITKDLPSLTDLIIEERENE